MFSAANAKSVLVTFSCQRDQKSIVALNGFSVGGSILILLGKSTESPTTIASPTSMMGNQSITCIHQAISSIFLFQPVNTQPTLIVERLFILLVGFSFKLGCLHLTADSLTQHSFRVHVVPSLTNGNDLIFGCLLACGYTVIGKGTHGWLSHSEVRKLH